MIGLEVFLFFLALLVMRLILPAGLLLLIGEWVGRKETRYWFR